MFQNPDQAHAFLQQLYDPQSFAMKMQKLQDPAIRQQLAIQLAMSGQPPPDLAAPETNPQAQQPTQISVPPPPQAPQAQQAPQGMNPASLASVAQPFMGGGGEGAGAGAGGGEGGAGGLASAWPAAIAAAVLGTGSALQHNNVSSVPHQLKGQGWSDILASQNVQKRLSPEAMDMLKPIAAQEDPRKWKEWPKAAWDATTAPWRYIAGLF